VTVPVALIAAVGRDGVIGASQALPWRLPGDFAHFKQTTLGKPLIMGRKTFESIGRPLPGRTNIIVTRQKGYQPEGVLVFDSLEAALDHAQAIAEIDRASEIMVGGGGEIYRKALPLAGRLYITHVDAAPGGDTTFPDIDPAEWMVVAEPDVPPDHRDTAVFRVKVYERRYPTIR
jgi:dihydrofolate reductase